MSDAAPRRPWAPWWFGSGVVAGLVVGCMMLLIVGPLTLGPLAFRAGLTGQHSLWIANSSGHDLVVRVYAADSVKTYLAGNTSEVDNGAAYSIPVGAWMKYQVMPSDRCDVVLAAGDVQASVEVTDLSIGPVTIWSAIDPRQGPESVRGAGETNLCPLH